MNTVTYTVTYTVNYKGYETRFKVLSLITLQSFQYKY